MSVINNIVNQSNKFGKPSKFTGVFGAANNQNAQGRFVVITINGGQSFTSALGGYSAFNIAEGIKQTLKNYGWQVESVINNIQNNSGDINIQIYAFVENQYNKTQIEASIRSQLDYYFNTINSITINENSYQTTAAQAGLQPVNIKPKVTANNNSNTADLTPTINAITNAVTGAGNAINNNLPNSQTLKDLSKSTLSAFASSLGISVPIAIVLIVAGVLVVPKVIRI